MAVAPRSAGNGRTVQPCPKEKPPPKRPITIRATLFFDGTLNNRTNTAARQRWEARVRRIGVRAGKRPGTGSYDNDYSNVAKLDQVLEDAQPGYDHAFHIYVEGIGTTDLGGDNKYGAGVGMGDTGVVGKVTRGLDQVVSRVIGLVGNPAEVYVAKLHLDSFGFSRGAAAARHFVQKAVRAGPERVLPRLNQAGITVSEVRHRFVGLFDTVASFGTIHTNDTRDLSLDAIVVAEKTVQLAAAEEHRENFDLTNIRSAGGKGLQIFLPGVHSDVGGGYVDGSGESDYQIYDIDVAWTGAAEKAALNRERTWLIRQGWYRPNEIEPTNFWNEIRVNRPNIRNTYARIPLQMMAKQAKTLQLAFTPLLADRHAVPGELRAVAARVEGAAASSPSAYFGSTDPMWVRLRHGYLHFSAHYGDIGMAPRWTNGDPISGRRTRRIHNG